ncbi:MAG: hypothetical protein V9H69_23300 [Anaerolineae bacterium]
MGAWGTAVLAGVGNASSAPPMLWPHKAAAASSPKTAIRPGQRRRLRNGWQRRGGRRRLWAICWIQAIP